MEPSPDAVCPVWRGTFGQRFVQYTLLFGAITPLKVLRASVPSFVPLLVSEFGFTQAQTAVLLSGFFPGYMCSMVPGAAITAACGAKAVMTAAMAGSAAIFYLMPTVAQRYGAGALSILLTVLGVIQGPLSAVNTQMRKEWVPTEKGFENERIWQLRSVSIAMQSTDLTAALVVPYLYARGSFSYACRWLATATAAACCVWQLFAKSRPLDLPGAPRPLEKDANSPAAQQKAVEWGIFRVPATWTMFLCVNIT
jgi:sugar phosphate permease